MALTDERKLAIAKKAFRDKIDSIESWDNFKSLIGGITPTQLKNFLKNNVDAESDEHSNAVTVHGTLSTDLTALGSEIDSIT